MLDMSNPTKVEDAINGLTGVVTQGLFAKRPADLLLVARKSGDVDEVRRQAAF